MFGLCSRVGVDIYGIDIGVGELPSRCCEEVGIWIEGWFFWEKTGYYLRHM